MPTERVSFRLTEPLVLNRVADLGADRDEVAAQPPGAFVSVGGVCQLKPAFGRVICQTGFLMG